MPPRTGRGYARSPCGSVRPVRMYAARRSSASPPLGLFLSPLPVHLLHGLTPVRRERGAQRVRAALAPDADRLIGKAHGPADRAVFDHAWRHVGFCIWAFNLHRVLPDLSRSQTGENSQRTAHTQNTQLTLKSWK